LALNLAMAIAVGQSFAGFKILGPRRVLYLSGEGGKRGIKKRLKKMMTVTGGEILDNLMIVPEQINLMNESDHAAVITSITDFRPDVIVIDPMVKFHELDENTSREMNQFLRVVRSMMEHHNISIILVHHQGKDPTKGGRGSSVIKGEYDTNISISTNPQNKQRSTLQFDLRHDESPNPRHLAFNSQTLWFMEFNENLVVKVLREASTPLTRDELRARLVQTGKFNDHSAYKPIQKALKDGVIIPAADGKFTLPHDSPAN